MNQYQYHKPKLTAYDVEVDVSYVPFPSEKARDEAYDTHIKLFLNAKERMLKGYRTENSESSNDKEGGLETALSSY